MSRDEMRQKIRGIVFDAQAVASFKGGRAQELADEELREATDAIMELVEQAVADERERLAAARDG